MFDYVGLASGPCKHLAYAVLGPRLMAFPGIRRQLPIDISMFNSWFRTLLGAPKDLNHFITQQRSHRLGFYHEALWLYFIDTFPQYELIAHNVAVRNSERTIGEFDFILRNRQDGLVYHLEVATKYYLEHQYQCDTFWIGPSLQDRFDIKADHLINHQIALSETPEGKAELVHLGVLEPIKVIAVGGTLFYKSQLDALDPFIAPEHQSAKHLTLGELNQRSDSSRWMLVSRRDWLAPLLMLKRDADTLSIAELCNHLAHEFDNDSQPVMVARMEQCEHHNFYIREHERLFITPDNWASKADESLQALNADVDLR